MYAQCLTCARVQYVIGVVGIAYCEVGKQEDGKEIAC